MKMNVSRRGFLRGASGLALPLPLGLVSYGRAQAAEKPPLRLVVLQNRDGTIPSEFWPRVVPQTQVDPQAWQHPLSAINGPLSGVLGTDFDAVRGKMNLVNGLDYLCNAFHQTSTWLCCAQTNKDTMGETGAPVVGSAVDCVVEHSAGFYKTAPPLAALRIADNNRRGSFWRPQGGTGPVSLKPYVQGAQAVWNAVIKGVGPTDGGNPGGTPASPSNDEKLLTDHLVGQYKAFLSSSRMGQEDKLRVQQHYDLVHDWQKLVAAGKVTTGPQLASCSDLSSKASTPSMRAIDRYNSYIDGIVTALACGVTRIASLSMDHFDDVGTTNFGQHHSNSHREFSNGKTPEENVRIWDGWIAKRVATLLTKLDSIKESDGSTLLDNCIVVWGNEDGYGFRHSSEGIPVLMAGGAGGKLRTGYYIDYRKRPAPPAGSNDTGVGVPLSGLWVSVMLALGVSPAEFNKQGDGGAFGQMLSEFASKHQDVQQRRTNPLPFLYQG